jgi:hypothetical protein
MNLAQDGVQWQASLKLGCCNMACGVFHKQLLKKETYSIPGQVIRDLQWIKWHWYDHETENQRPGPKGAVEPVKKT